MKKLLVADLFCGAGGSSTGARRALAARGIEMQLVAVNHWPVAIETHQLNHPDARHYCVNLDSARPLEIVPEGRLDLLMASPECTHHSRARGGRPMNDQSRMSAWHVVRWATELRVRAILIENVPEFVEWGPIGTSTGRPISRDKGKYFGAFVTALQEIGFEVEWRVLNAADYGDATTRRRLFMIARSDRRPIRWPEPTHTRDGGEDLFGDRPRWRAAREIIDWSRAGRSIFDRKKPLAAKTLTRIMAGATKFNWPEPFLVVLRQHMTATSIDGPVPTITGGGNHIALAQPSMAPFVLAQGAGGAARDVDDPLPTVVGRGAISCTAPVLVPVTGGEKPKAPRSVEDPLGTITTKNGVGLAEAVMVNMKGRSDAGSVDAPAPTITAHARHLALAQPVLAPYYGSGSGETCSSIEDPLPTVTTKARFGIVEPDLMPLVLGQQSCAAARAVDDPIPTVATAGRISLIEPVAEPFTISPRHAREGAGPTPRCADQPLPTITAGGSQLGIVEAVAAPFILNRHGDNGGTRAHDVEQPIPTPTTSGAGYVVQPFIVPQFGERDGQQPRVHSVEAPLPSVTSHGAGAIVEPVVSTVDIERAQREGRVLMIDGVPHLLDIRFRMLEPYELGRAMGFSDAETDYEFAGTKTEVTKQIGNAVPVNTAMALVAAIMEAA